MSSGFAGVPGWRSRTRGGKVGRGFRARAGRVGRRRGMNPRPTRGASCSTVAWANSASTAPQLSPAFSTCPPGASLFLAPPTTLLATLRRARPTTSRAPANSHWPRRIDATANPLLLPPPLPPLYFIILLIYPTTTASTAVADACAPFLYSFFATSWRCCTREPGQEGGRLARISAI